MVLRLWLGVLPLILAGCGSVGLSFGPSTSDWPIPSAYDPGFLFVGNLADSLPGVVAEAPSVPYGGFVANSFGDGDGHVRL